MLDGHAKQWVNAKILMVRLPCENSNDQSTIKKK